ncbi:hypothetical protein GCM10023340_33820 [Nocardioides marinquilinus]|uniref:Uncharacterized protein n=1 Tax=Nocardioides marinquilinus TaxID=1210400 RepID=A0ABP9PVK0_9ACTN
MTHDHWQVLVEEVVGALNKPTTVRIQPELHAGRDAALDAALEVATSFVPSSPALPLGRDVYRDGDGFFVVMHGRTSAEHHFGVRIVQHVARRDT